MAFWPIPSIPENTALLKVIYLKPNNDSVMIQSFNFLADSVPTTFSMAQAFKIDIKTWATSVITDTYSNDVSFSYVWFFYKWGAVIHSSGDSSGATAWTPVHYNSPCIATTICGCFTRRTGIAGANTIGRVYSPPIPRAFVSGNKINSTGATILHLSAIAQTASWISQGVTFTPALWSIQLGNCYALSDVAFLDHPCRIYKRRIIYPYVRPFLLWPLVP
jgi:hypothetical protein